MSLSGLMAGGQRKEDPASIVRMDLEDFLKDKKGDDESEEDDDADEDDAEFLRQQEKMAAMQKGRSRASISAERWEASADWKAPVHEKTSEQRAAIKASCLKSFIFQALEAPMLEQVLDAFKGPINMKAGDEVIKQGDKVGSEDNGLYIIESGTLDVFKTSSASDAKPGPKVFMYDKQGQSFGELALLYNCPRAATVVASSESVLWSINRDTFNNCVKGAAQKIHERREKFLETVEILKGLNKEERSKIADVLQPREFAKGERIITEGDAGSEFYIIEEGAAHAEKKDVGKVKEYAQGDYFGELALIKEQVRAASVIASANVKLVALDSESFKRLLGPLTDIMKERAKEYEGVAPIA
eukprot:TRINITY_DN125331_c0_g1_i1.p1 TRINITY_DN125331_c0_g1~~TRINITY_DN125331_c0_g1_i1.p1  ORF type:complete len:357 (+),score=131.94 TRINITY_DN125331_c0_g1_i1:135-1205(+)